MDSTDIEKFPMPTRISIIQASFFGWLSQQKYTLKGAERHNDELWLWKGNLSKRDLKFTGSSVQVVHSCPLVTGHVHKPRIPP